MKKSTCFPSDVCLRSSKIKLTFCKTKPNKLKVAPTMAEPSTNDVCGAVKRAVNRIVNEDEEMSGTCGENKSPVPNTCVTSGTSKTTSQQNVHVRPPRQHFAPSSRIF